jgi:hypothetical protein
VKISNASSNISQPTDLDFNPTRPGELWITNQGTENTGGSTVMVTALNTTDPVFEYRKDQNSWHFMSRPTGIAFGDNGNFATSTGVRDANHQGGTFTGPALWSSDLNIYARPSGGNGSHLDMLHGSPFCMGIAWERENVYWVMDGFNQHICRYDFGQDHGPGNANHDDGRIQRFMNVSVKRNGDIPCHMQLDQNKENLYFVDGGNKRVVKLLTGTGQLKRSLPLVNEQLAEHSEWGADFKILSQDLFDNYCGLAINENRLFISDYDTGDIVCIDLTTGYTLGRISTGVEGITGMKG